MTLLYVWLCTALRRLWDALSLFERRPVTFSGMGNETHTFKAWRQAMERRAR